MKSILIFLSICIASSAGAGVSGHTYAITGVQKSTADCDDTASAIYSFYQEGNKEELPYLFSLDTVCFAMEAGVFFETQLLIEPRNEAEIEAVEKYVANKDFADIHGMKLEIKKVKYLMKHMLLQYRKEVSSEHKELKAEHQVTQMFFSYSDLKADLENMKQVFLSSTWKNFYLYITPLVGEHLIGMTRYYSAKRSDEIAGLTSAFWITEDDQIHEELGVRHVYRDCGNFSTDGRCR